MKYTHREHMYLFLGRVLAERKMAHGNIIDAFETPGAESGCCRHREPLDFYEAAEANDHLKAVRLAGGIRKFAHNNNNAFCVVHRRCTWLVEK